MPVGTHPHLLVMGASSHVAVQGPARFGARQGANRRLRSADQHMSRRLNAEGFKILYVYKRQNLPLGWSTISFRGWTLLEYSHVHGRDMYLNKLLAARRYGRIWIGGGRWSWRRKTGKHCKGMAFDDNRPTT
jgi:hypothetical protein